MFFPDNPEYDAHILAMAKAIVKRKATQQKHKVKQLQETIPVDLTTDKTYSTIVIDPPWKLTKNIRLTRSNQTEWDYPCMSIEQIKSIPIPAAKNCHLYLWTTERYLPDAFQVLTTWGFKYVFTMVWVKNGGPQPFGSPQFNCEFVLVGRKGKLPFQDTTAFFCAFYAKRREHSRKPERFYQLVRRVSPGPRLDMFSREPRDGFDQHGIETSLFETHEQALLGRV